MPNLDPPILTTQQAETYFQHILELVPKTHNFKPLMTLFLTEQSDIMDIREGVKKGIVTAVKLYPAGATTNSPTACWWWSQHNAITVRRSRGCKFILLKIRRFKNQLL